MKLFGRILFYFLIMVAPLGYGVAQTRTLTLEQYLSEVSTHSPDLKIEKANIEAAEAKASGIRIPPPMVGLMQMKDGEGTNQGYEISQELPFPTKIAQDKKVRSLESETQREASNFQNISVLSDARLAYVSYWSASEKLKVLKEKHAWLKHHVMLSKATTRASTTDQIHLLSVEADEDMTENEVLSLEAEVLEKKNMLRTFAPDLKMDDIALVEPPLASFEIVKADSRNPLVSWKEKEIEALSANESLRKQAYVPDVFLRLRSFNGNASTPQSQELMVGVSLPFLYFWQPKAEVAEASAQRMRAEAELRKVQIESETKFESLKKRSEAIKAQLKNIDDKLLPRAQRRLRLVKNLSQRTMEGLDEHKSVMVSYLDLKTQSINLRFEHESIFREILKLTGQNFKVGGP